MSAKSGEQMGQKTAHQLLFYDPKYGEKYWNLVEKI